MEKIIKYCDEIDLIMERFGRSCVLFSNDFAYRYDCSMCIFQIGELASKLSEDFRDKYNGVPWNKIRGIRNIFAHDYESINNDEIWATIETKVPELKKYCEYILKDMT